MVINDNSAENVLQHFDSFIHNESLDDSNIKINDSLHTILRDKPSLIVNDIKNDDSFQVQFVKLNNSIKTIRKTNLKKGKFNVTGNTSNKLSNVAINQKKLHAGY